MVAVKDFECMARPRRTCILGRCWEVAVPNEKCQRYDSAGADMNSPYERAAGVVPALEPDISALVQPVSLGIHTYFERYTVSD